MTVNEFVVIHVNFKEHNITEQLFVKAYNTTNKRDDRPPELTLLVYNVPPYCTRESLAAVFSACGPVNDVFFALVESPNVIFPKQVSKIFREPEPPGEKIAYIVFASPNGLQNALRKKTLSLSPDQCRIVTGLEKYIQESIPPDPEEIKKEVSEYMKKYDESQKLQSELEKQLAEPDEEGWITVTRIGRRPGFARRKFDRENLKKKKKKELVNFYTFQIKESKMKQLAALKQRFDEDKKIIEEMKSRRKFNPF